jgi:hypothetical protein
MEKTCFAHIKRKQPVLQVPHPSPPALDRLGKQVSLNKCASGSCSRTIGTIFFKKNSRSTAMSFKKEENAIRYKIDITKVNSKDSRKVNTKKLMGTESGWI